MLESHERILQHYVLLAFARSLPAPGPSVDAVSDGDARGVAGKGDRL